MNWQAILALVLQILSQIKPKPAAAFSDHKDALCARVQAAIDVGTITGDVTKVLAFVEGNWAAIMALVTAAETAFGA